MPADTLSNQQFRLAARPVGLPRDSHWQLATEPVPPIDAGAVVVKTLYLSLDPAMRGWMNEGRSYIRPVAIGEVMRAGGGFENFPTALLMLFEGKNFGKLVLKLAGT